MAAKAESNIVIEFILLKHEISSQTSPAAAVMKVSTIQQQRSEQLQQLEYNKFCASVVWLQKEIFPPK